MNTLETMLAPLHTWEIPLVLPGAGTLQLRVSADNFVEAFVLDPVNRDAYKRGASFTSLYPSQPNRLHSANVSLSYGGPWFVLVRSLQSLPVRVQADINFVPYMPTPTGYTGSIPTGSWS